MFLPRRDATGGMASCGGWSPDRLGLSGVRRSPSPTWSLAKLHGLPDFRRLLVGLLLVVPAVLAFVPSGRAQAPVSARFAFADTTLLRDTLGLKFDRLFETADSLRMLPDSLRAQMIRYLLPMFRLIMLCVVSLWLRCA